MMNQQPQQDYSQGYMQAGGYPNQQYQQPPQSYSVDPSMNNGYVNNMNMNMNNNNNMNNNVHMNCMPPEQQMNSGYNNNNNNNNFQQINNCYPPQQNNFQQPMGNYPPNNNNMQMNNNIQMNNIQMNNNMGMPMNNNNNYPPPQNNMPMQMNNTMPMNNMNNNMMNNNVPMQNNNMMNNTMYPQQQMPGQLNKAAPGLMQGPKLTKFFVDIRKRLNRDYIVIMDMSGSMRGQKWEQAKAAIMQIAPFACQGDPDGITLYLFSGEFFKYEHLQQAEQVQAIFSQQKPRGQTNMTAVLRSAFNDHFTGNKPTTILVVTDGAPDSQSTTTREIVGATSRLNSNEDLSISFIQIGNDTRATQYLKFLDDSLMAQGAKFDIVDTVTAAEVGTMSFDQLVQKSIYD